MRCAGGRAADLGPDPLHELALTRMGQQPVLGLGSGLGDGLAGLLTVPVAARRGGAGQLGMAREAAQSSHGGRGPDRGGRETARRRHTAPDPTTPMLSNSARDANEAVTWGVRVAAAWTWRLLIIAVGPLRARPDLRARRAGRVLASSSPCSSPPCCTRSSDRLRTLPGPRSLSAGLALLIGVLALAAIGTFVTWQITSHSTQLGDQINDFVEKTRTWLQTGPLHLKSSDLDKLAKNISDAVKRNQGALVSGAIETVRTVAEALGALLLILLSTFFLLRDGDQIWRWTLRLFPRQAQERMDRAGRVGWRTLGGYMRGQVLIALFHGMSVTIVLLVAAGPARRRTRRTDLPRLVRPADRPHGHRRAVHRGRAARARRSRGDRRRGRDHRCSSSSRRTCCSRGS